jgi:hypothetical protein
MLSFHFSRHCLTIVGYFAPHTGPHPGLADDAQELGSQVGVRVAVAGDDMYGTLGMLKRRKLVALLAMMGIGIASGLFGFWEHSGTNVANPTSTCVICKCKAVSTNLQDKSCLAT